MEFKNRVFIGDDNKPYLAELIKDECIMIYYLHPDNKWVSLKRIHIGKGRFILDNLSEKEQALYPAFNKG